jgi:hypothetical protein
VGGWVGGGWRASGGGEPERQELSLGRGELPPTKGKLEGKARAGAGVYTVGEAPRLCAADACLVVSLRRTATATAAAGGRLGGPQFPKRDAAPCDLKPLWYFPSFHISPVPSRAPPRDLAAARSKKLLLHDAVAAAVGLKSLKKIYC